MERKEHNNLNESIKNVFLKENVFRNMDESAAEIAMRAAEVGHMAIAGGAAAYLGRQGVKSLRQKWRNRRPRNERPGVAQSARNAVTGTKKGIKDVLRAMAARRKANELVSSKNPKKIQQAKRLYKILPK